jgi:hypothetical protein
MSAHPMVSALASDGLTTASYEGVLRNSVRYRSSTLNVPARHGGSISAGFPARYPRAGRELSCPTLRLIQTRGFRRRAIVKFLAMT